MAVSKNVLFWTLGVASAASLCYFLTFRRKALRRLFRKKRELTREDVLAVLRRVADAFHLELSEAGQSVQRAEMIAAQKKSPYDPRHGLKDEELASMLMDGGVGYKLQQHQLRILEELDVAEEEMQDGSSVYASDPEIKRLVSGLDLMVFAYLEGGLPVHPAYMSSKEIEALSEESNEKFHITRMASTDINRDEKSPTSREGIEAELVPEKRLIGLLSEIMAEKAKRIGQFLNEGEGLIKELPSSENVSEMARISKEVESEFLAREKISMSQLQSSLANGTNQSESFRKKLMGLLYQFQSIPRVFSHE